MKQEIAEDIYIVPSLQAKEIKNGLSKFLMNKKGLVGFLFDHCAAS